MMLFRLSSLLCFALFVFGCSHLIPDNNSMPPTELPVVRITPRAHTPVADGTGGNEAESVGIARGTVVPACPRAPQTRLIIQERARVTDTESLNLRAGPGTDFEILARIEPGNDFFVLEGPTCAEVYSWYRVRHRRQEGWIAEGDLETYYVTPYLPG